MTALKQFQRLEATGLWRPAPGAQRREVVVSLGEATLTISSTADQALAHWSLAAIERAPGTDGPALYHPEGDPSETLELDASDMVDAIETLRRAIRRARPRSGRLRWLGAGLSVAAVAALCMMWLPGALTDHALRVVPEVTRVQIGTALLARMERVTGAPCRTGAAADGLRALERRTGVPRLSVVPTLGVPSLALPGGRVVLDRTVLEDFEAPDVAAGYVLAEAARSEVRAPLRDVLEASGFLATTTLLTTGRLPDRALDAYALGVLREPRTPVAAEALLALFAAAELPSAPYAYALDPSGEATLALIEGDPAQAGADPIMPDGVWLRLQAICGA
ncbi:MAG: hypothetical protein AAGF60_09455 [Pseudomonadota bacterium]